MGLSGVSCRGSEWGLVDAMSLSKEMINRGDDMSYPIMMDILALVRKSGQRLVALRCLFGLILPDSVIYAVRDPRFNGSDFGPFTVKSAFGIRLIKVKSALG